MVSVPNDISRNALNFGPKHKKCSKQCVLVCAQKLGSKFWGHFPLQFFSQKTRFQFCNLLQISKLCNKNGIAKYNFSL